MGDEFERPVRPSRKRQQFRVHLGHCFLVPEPEGPVRGIRLKRQDENCQTGGMTFDEILASFEGPVPGPELAGVSMEGELYPPEPGYTLPPDDSEFLRDA